jgi:hypothetical protein
VSAVVRTAVARLVLNAHVVVHVVLKVSALGPQNAVRNVPVNQNVRRRKNARRRKDVRRRKNAVRASAVLEVEAALEVVK